MPSEEHVTDSVGRVRRRAVFGTSPDDSGVEEIDDDEDEEEEEEEEEEGMESSTEVGLLTHFTVRGLASVRNRFIYLGCYHLQAS